MKTDLKWQRIRGGEREKKKLQRIIDDLNQKSTDWCNKNGVAIISFNKIIQPREEETELLVHQASKIQKSWLLFFYDHENVK